MIQIRTSPTYQEGQFSLPEVCSLHKVSHPSLNGWYLSTLGTAGIGKQAIFSLSRHKPSHISFTGRNGHAADSVITQAKTMSPNTQFTFIECDQTSLDSTQMAAKKYLTGSKQLDILICNAGIMGVPPALTKDGFEIQFGVNYLAHAMLIKLFLPTLERTAADKGEARIVMLSSAGFKYPPKGGIVFDDLNTPQANLGLGAKWARYGQSKLATVLQAKQLAQRHPSITTLCIHPGTIHTGLIDNLSLGDRLWVKFATIGQAISLREGAYNTCWAATTSNQSKLQSGGLYAPVGIPMPDTSYSSDKKLAEKLWDWTTGQLEAYV